jgi:hypothetical protein
MNRCKSLTNEDDRCSRNVMLGRRYCWQHESIGFKVITISTIIGTILALIGLFADLKSLGIPIPDIPNLKFRSELSITPSLTATAEWEGPCSITKVEPQPPSPQPTGSLVIIRINATCESGVRAIRLLINGEHFGEKGGHAAPPEEFIPSWNTEGFDPGLYILTAEVATWGDNDWKHSSKVEINYELTKP